MITEMTTETAAGTMVDAMDETLSESMPGRFRVCITDRSIHDAALELSASLTEGGEPLLIMDACDCFQPSRISRCAPHSAGLLHVVRATMSQPVMAALGTLETMGEI